ncbi:MAG: hypothetical protein V4677_06115 [Bacteroidota bacterium]
MTSIINKYSALLFLIFLSAIYCAQDTIFTNSSQSLLVRVLEISKTEVSYKNFFNPDGIVRVLSNDQILRIVYENGKEESRFQLKQKTAGSPSPLTMFVIEEKYIALNNKDITHKAAFKIMMKKDPQTNSEELNGALIQADSKQNGQIAFNIIAPAAAVGGIYFARQHRYNTPREKMIAKTYFISGLSLCVVSVITAQIYRSLKNKHIRKAALLYNNEMP